MSARAGRGSGLRVACAQLAARSLGDAEIALGEALEAVAEAARLEADLVILPECTYPAYVLAPHPGAPAPRPDAEVEAAFAESARAHGISLAVGLAQGYAAGGSGVWNRALLFAPDGTVMLRVAKRFLWDFDRCWFEPGTASDPVSMGGVPVGMLVCADVRMPEIARSLAVGGARLILDPTAWVTTGRDAGMLSNPQPEFLMSVRAYENGVWMAAANKVGVERDAVIYAGRSGIFAPDGSVVAMAGSTDPEIVWAEIDLAAATGPAVTRRPELYGGLVNPPSSTEVWARVRAPLVPVEATSRIGLLQQLELPSGGGLADELREEEALVNALSIDLLAACVRSNREDLGDVARRLHRRLSGAVALGEVDERGRVVRCVLASTGRLLDAAPTHGASGARGGSLDARTVDLGSLRLGVMVGDEGLVPEVGRVLALEGSELLLWFSDRETPMAEAIALGRSLENRVYVAVVRPGAEDALAALADPDGRVAAIGLEGRRQLVSGWVQVAAARLKTMARGTDTIADRQPELYTDLVRGPG